MGLHSGYLEPYSSRHSPPTCHSGGQRQIGMPVSVQGQLLPRPPIWWPTSAHDDQGSPLHEASVLPLLGPLTTEIARAGHDHLRGSRSSSRPLIRDLQCFVSLPFSCLPSPQSHAAMQSYLTAPTWHGHLFCDHVETVPIRQNLLGRGERSRCAVGRSRRAYQGYSCDCRTVSLFSLTDATAISMSLQA
jgi:hypothetical protein